MISPRRATAPLRRESRARFDSSFPSIPPQIVRAATESRPHRVIPQDDSGRRAGRAIDAKFRARTGIGENHRGDEIAVVTGDHHVADKWRKMSKNFRAERSHAHPSSVRELEILGQPPVEQQTFVDIVRIDESHRVAECVEAFFIEDFLRQFRLTPVAGRYVGPANAGFEFRAAAARASIRLPARESDRPCVIRFPRCLDRHR